MRRISPVVIGANEPLTGKWAGRVSIIHGENGLGNVELPKSERKPFDKGIEEILSGNRRTFTGRNGPDHSRTSYQHCKNH